MNHSDAYNDFKQQLKATGRQKMEGYYPGLLDRIYEEERKEVEKDIWRYFVRKDDTGLAVFMPYLKEYDGIGALKAKLSEFKVPSSGSADIAFVLFNMTEDKQYLDIIMDNYRGLPFNTPIAADLARLAKRPHVYSLLEDIYINDKDEVNRLQALEGILWKCGKLNSPDDFAEVTQNIDMIRSYCPDSAEEREEIIKSLRQA